jgi:hypothetical protein
MNFSQNGINNYRVGMPRAGMWRVRFNGDWNGYDPSFSNWGTFDTNASTTVPWDGLPASALVNIGPYSAVVFSQGNPPPPANPADVTGDGQPELLIGEGSYSANNIHLLANQGAPDRPSFDAAKRTQIALGEGRQHVG